MRPHLTSQVAPTWPGADALTRRDVEAPDGEFPRVGFVLSDIAPNEFRETSRLRVAFEGETSLCDARGKASWTRLRPKRVKK